MSEPTSSSLEPKRSLQGQDGISSANLQLLSPALKVGAVSGSCGLFVGAIAGIIRSANPVLFSVASGIQCSILGSTITVFRELIIHSWGKAHISPDEKLLVSSIAGALGGGTCGAILRSRRNILPGAIMFAIFTFTGQAIYNKLEHRAVKQNSQNSKGMKSWVASKWSPLRVMSDKEYEAILNNKLLEIKAEIALIDKKIAALQKK